MKHLMALYLMDMKNEWILRIRIYGEESKIMWKKLSRIIAAVLFVSMIMGNISLGEVAAAESIKNENQSSVENDVYFQNSETSDDNYQPEGNSNILPGEEIQDQPAVEDSSPSILEEEENNSTDINSGHNETDNGIDKDKNITESTDEASYEQNESAGIKIEESDAASFNSENINFIYVESIYLETPGTQRIVVAFENDLKSIQSLTLTVKDPYGKSEEWPLVTEKDGVYLFEKYFSGDAYTGTYQAVSLNLIDANEEHTLNLSDKDLQAEFGVNEVYEGAEELQPIDNEQNALNGIESSVVTIDEDGVTQAQNSIADALNTVSTETLNASSVNRSAAVQSSRTGNIVVALDPGHDAKDAGAQGFGLKEEDLTLKIANYCKEELEQYSGVEVYMTRTGAACPYDKAGANCIENRVNAAADAGAQIFVSFHLNSSTASSAKGAEVIIQNKNWRPALAEEGEELANAILDELVKVGLTKRGTPIYSKDSGSGNKYSDGSLADYFAVQRYSKMRNIPGIIIEHAFISNADEVNRFLKTEDGLKKLGVADASGIAKYLGLSKGYWDTDSQGNQYYYEGGQKVKGEKKIGLNWYYFDPKTGAMRTGIVNLGEKTVYYAPNGQMQYGEQKIDGSWYYFKPGNGAMQTGIVDLGEKTVYYASSGQMQYGEQKIDGNWYYFKPGNGAMQTGIVDLGEKTVYYAPNGQMQYGEQRINGSWYYFKPGNGAMQTGIVDLGEKTVYYASNGQMQYGEQKIDGSWYYFKPGTGAMQTGIVDLGEKTVYYASNGQMQYGEQRINGSWYYFKPGNGAMQTGIVDLGEKTVYYASNGQMQYGEQKIDGSWYYFKPGTGAMQIGFVDLENKRVYYDYTGKMVYGERVISGHYYYFKEGSGAMCRSEWFNGFYYDENGHKASESFTPILGKSQATISQLITYYQESNNQYPAFYADSDAPTLEDFCAIYYEEAEKQGIRAEVAFVQAMKETAWLKFGNDVKIEQYNFAGLGAVGDGAGGASFETVREGVRAQIQHLYAYASSEGKEGLASPCVDPRFDLVSPKGGAPYVEWLGKSENPVENYGWATDQTYGLKLLLMLRDCLE